MVAASEQEKNVTVIAVKKNAKVAKAALEAAEENLKMVSLAVKDSDNAAKSVLEALQVQMKSAKDKLKNAWAEAKRELPEDDELLVRLNLKGPCTNSLCLCPICECGASCQCNVSEEANKETCEQCTEFRADKKIKNT